MDPEEILQSCIDPSCLQRSMKGKNTAAYCRNEALKRKFGSEPKRNQADGWKKVFEEIQDKEKYPFVRLAWLDDKTGTPCCMVYSDNMISDMKNLIGSNNNPSTVFGVRLCSLYYS